MFLLVAGLGPVHALFDEILEACPIALSESHGQGHSHGDPRDLSESDPCHEHCAVAQSKALDRSIPLVHSSVADAAAPMPGRCCTSEHPGAETVRGIARVSRGGCSSAYHLRVGLRLYA